MEGAHAMATGVLLELSEQQLVDCVDGGADDCQHGGEMQHGFHYAIKHGSEAEKVYPYEATSSHRCRTNLYKEVATFVAFGNVTAYDERSLTSAVALHPGVAVAIDASAFGTIRRRAADQS